MKVILTTATMGVLLVAAVAAMVWVAVHTGFAP